MQICARTERDVSKSDGKIRSNIEVSRKGRQRERTSTCLRKVVGFCFGLLFFSWRLVWDKWEPDRLAFVPGLCQELLSRELVMFKARTSARPEVWLLCNLKEKNKPQCLIFFPWGSEHVHLLVVSRGVSLLPSVEARSDHEQCILLLLSNVLRICHREKKNANAIVCGT